MATESQTMETGNAGSGVVGVQRLVSARSMRLETLGLGDAYDPAAFEPVRNRPHNKPFGGLWASPIGCEWGWRQWCEAEEWGDLSSRFEFDYSGRTLVIETAADLDAVIWQEAAFDFCNWPDYEAMRAAGVDAIYLTEAGQQATRFSTPRNLYGYDCECVLVMNPECIRAR